MDGRKLALAFHLDIYPGEIVEAGYGDNTFEVSPGRRRRGASPEYWAAIAGTIREIVGIDKWQNIIRSIIEHNMKAVYQDVNPHAQLWAQRYGLFTKGLDDVRVKWAFQRMIDENTIEPLCRDGAYRTVEHFAYRVYEGAMPRPEDESHKYVNALHFLLSGDDKDWHVRAIRAGYNGETIKDDRPWDHINGGEYLVLTDEEADELWDEYLEQYIDDCILPEVPESSQQYFNREAWKRDARVDGRGHTISPYDGNETEVDRHLVWDWACKLYEHEEEPETEDWTGDDVAEWLKEEFDDADPEENYFIYRMN